MAAAARWTAKYRVILRGSIIVDAQRTWQAADVVGRLDLIVGRGIVYGSRLRPIAGRRPAVEDSPLVRRGGVSIISVRV